MRYLYFDFESKSSADIGSCGLYRYMEDPDFELLLLAWCFDDAEVQLIDFTAGETFPEDFLAALTDPQIYKVAHNAQFERNAVRTVLGIEIPAEQVVDTMTLAAECGLPLSLAQVCEALGFGEDKAKMREGSNLIRKFCCPRKPTKTNPNLWLTPADAPEDWETFKAYCKRDVESEREIHRVLRGWMYPQEEVDFYALDSKINERGIRLDLTLAKNALEMDERYKAELTDKAIALTGMDNPSSVAQVKAWLKEQEGVDVPSLNKKSVSGVVEALQTDAAKEFMNIRAELSKTSTRKYEAVIRCACKDEHARGCVQFFGGHTGRFAGRLIQLQNLPQTHMEDLDDAREIVRDGDYEFLRAVYPSVTNTLSELIRTTLIPEEGHKFCVADFSAIEARVSAWLAGEEWVLKAFEDGQDIYCATASAMFKVPVVKNGENGELRQKGKIATLACVAEGQLVLTDRGLVPIEDIRDDDLLWDGENWVMHEGLVFNGLRDTIFIGGIEVTPDHKILTEEGMITADEAEGLNWAAIHEPIGAGTQRRVSLADGRSQIPVFDILNAGAKHRFCIYDPLTKQLRCVSNCGYGGGVGALKAFGADRMGLSPEEMAGIIDTWRAANPHIVMAWKSLGNAAIRCITHQGTFIDKVCGIRFRWDKGIMWMRLPSGREMAYYHPQYGPSEFNPQEMVISYMGVHQQKRKWLRIETRGSRILENLVQATSRDILREAMFALDRDGWDIRAHVHDEVICTEPLTGRSADEMARTMCPSIPWAAGLPLKAEGYECSSYRKM